MKIFCAILLISVFAFAESATRRLRKDEGIVRAKRNATDEEKNNATGMRGFGVQRNFTRIREIMRKKARRAKAAFVLTPEQKARFAEVEKELGREKPKRHHKSVAEVNEGSELSDVLFEGDILLTDEQAEMLVEEDGKVRRKRQAINPTGSFNLWESTTIPYVLDASLCADALRVIPKGLKFWQDNTCLTFVEDPSANKPMTFIGASGCWSKLGRLSASSQEKQEVSIQEKGCEHIGTVTHEVGHALGFVHTQSRWDRDEYIDIFVDNIQSGKAHNFDKYSEADNDNLGLPYEYGSVMHYGLFSFSVDEEDEQKGTIVPKDPNYFYTIGSGREPSFNDVRMMNKLYSCPDCPGVTLPCEHGGYPNPKDGCAKCKCPSGYGGDYCNQRPSGCGETLDATPTEQSFTISVGGEAITDEYEDCIYWIQAPEGSRVVAKLANTQCTAYSAEGCYWCGAEFKAQEDQTLAGYRFCYEKHLNNTITSYGPLLPIIIYSRVWKTTFVVTYYSEADPNPPTSSSSSSSTSSDATTSTSSSSSTTSSSSSSSSSSSTSSSSSSSSTSSSSGTGSTGTTSSSSSTSSSTPQSTTSTADGACTDEVNCASFVPYCSSSAYRDIMLAKCRKTCALCNVPVPTTTTTVVTTTTVCTDEINCASFVPYCSSSAYRDIMLAKCRKTCALCNVPVPTTTTTVATTTKECRDEITCDAFTSYCSVSAYKDMMSQKCRKTCKMC